MVSHSAFAGSHCAIRAAIAIAVPPQHYPPPPALLLTLAGMEVTLDEVAQPGLEREYIPEGDVNVRQGRTVPQLALQLFQAVFAVPSGPATVRRGHGLGKPRQALQVVGRLVAEPGGRVLRVRTHGVP